MRKSTARARGLLNGKGERIRPMTAGEFKRQNCNKRVEARADAKFNLLTSLNGLIDTGNVNARKAKAAMIERDTDGRSRHERQAKSAAMLWNPTGKRHATGRDDTQWINRKNAGKAGKFAGKGL